MKNNLQGYVRYQDQVKQLVRHLCNVAEQKMKLFISPAPAKFNRLRASPAPQPTSQIVLGTILCRLSIRNTCFAFQGDSSMCQNGFFSK
jgi:hypothetical protein